MIRFTIILIWLYLVVEFITQFVLSYSYIELGKRQRDLEIQVTQLKLNDAELEYKIAHDSSLNYANQLGTQWGFNIPRKDQVIRLD